MVTAAELADRFDLSIRTVYRDIRALEEAGVPIGSEAGVGYFISESYHLPPVRFSNEEASALLIGAKFVERMSDMHTRRAYQSALFKIKSVLNTKEKDDLERLQDNILVFAGRKGDGNDECALLTDVQQAILSRTVLDIEYHAGYTDQVTLRRVEPIGMIFYAGYWHIIGFCQLRNDYRDLRLDRILSLQRMDIPFSITAHISLDEYFERMKSQVGMHRISLRVARGSEIHVKEAKYWYGFTHEEECPDEKVILHFRNSDLRGFASWVMLGGKSIAIVEPNELKEEVKMLVKDLTEVYH